MTSTLSLAQGPVGWALLYIVGVWGQAPLCRAWGLRAPGCVPGQGGGGWALNNVRRPLE